MPALDLWHKSHNHQRPEYAGDHRVLRMRTNGKTPRLTTKPARQTKKKG